MDYFKSDPLWPSLNQGDQTVYRLALFVVGIYIGIAFPVPTGRPAGQTLSDRAKQTLGHGSLVKRLNVGEPNGIGISGPCQPADTWSLPRDELLPPAERESPPGQGAGPSSRSRCMAVSIASRELAARHASVAISAAREGSSVSRHASSPPRQTRVTPPL